MNWPNLKKFLKNIVTKTEKNKKDKMGAKKLTDRKY